MYVRFSRTQDRREPPREQGKTEGVKMSEFDSGELIQTNYFMAAGRIGIAVILVPLLWGLAVLLYLDNPGNIVFSILLGLLGVPLIWYAVTVPTSLRIGDQLVVNYPLTRLALNRTEIQKVEFTTLGTKFTLRHLIAHRYLPAKRVPVAVITTSNGRRITVLAQLGDVERIRQRLASSG